MGELRKDYILDRYVVISAGRGKRPREFKQPKPEIIEESCFFCPGHEQLTPPEIGRIAGKDGWQVRWFANKFAAFAPEGNALLRTDNRFFTFASNYGHHEVIVETPDHTRQLSELSMDEILL
ncbi:galactose-1-phosphate uridylyltransferase, partial [Candidatus Woesearchaeota archaeon]|nr:galactose-1-phosphate uridylyltransferase [Candidatus Woesearchaeota archaeon]